MQALDYQVHDGVATITLNRPEARNALSGAMKEELTAVSAQAASDPAVRAVVLTGAGGAFCAGGDLRGMAEARGRTMRRRWRDRMRDVHPVDPQLLELDKPLVAAVDGAAYGAGFSLALMADFVVATPARALLPELHARGPGARLRGHVHAAARGGRAARA
jgi:2-(1,2-epoxy-1,2-dihydrophenyl)acetyl-CoA isomerase